LTHPPFDLAAIRTRIPILRHAIPMNNCSQAPLCDATRQAAEEFLASWNERGMDWDRWMEEVSRARECFARCINATPDEIACVTSLSHAANVIASATDYSGARRVIVASEAEFPTVGHIWLAQQSLGATVRWVPLVDGAPALDGYTAAVDEHTAIVSVTHAYYLNGARQDLGALARLAHAHGALLFVDAYQTVGTAPLDVKAAGVDVLAAGTLKFLMGTPGVAFLYVRRGLIDRLRPTVTGWFGRANPFAFDTTHLDWSDRATRFEAGTPSIFSAYVSRAGMSLLLEVGLEAIGEWNAVLSRRLAEGGESRGLRLHGPGLSRPRSPTTAFVCPGDSHAVEARLRARGVIASARGPVIRLAPHFYTSLEDCDRALDALAAEIRA
jgi:selenocysteine lyase/cysteine desulfurase